MERPQIRQIENQSVESEKEITGYEAEQILRKYGHETQYSTRPTTQNNSQVDLTFDQMIELEERKKKEEEDRKRAKLYGPRPTTFSAERGYDSEVKYGKDEDSGFGFKIEITTDMNLPRY